MEQNRIYISIDLKSFYASVECVERGLDPLTTNLVVADKSRTEKTVCLAVTPGLKQYGISGRARLYQVIEKVKEINVERKVFAPKKEFTAKSTNSIELKNNPELELDFIVAEPRMAYYMKYSTDIYKIYLKYFSKDDIYVYSVDEIFCDITDYLNTYKMTPRELTTKVIKDVYETTGITATAGIGTNLYLSKVAMDIGAKHVKEDENGVRIAELDEMSYRKILWEHKPITDFWRVGKGIATKLAKYGMYTMGDVALCAVENEELLYKLFGINAELLIDHAFGYEPCTIKDIKGYRPESKSLSLGQVLHEPYTADDAELIVKEMVEQLSFNLVEQKLITDQIVLTIEYDVENLNEKIGYTGKTEVDWYGRVLPKHAHGTENLGHKTSSFKIMEKAAVSLYNRIINKKLLVRKIYVVANNVVNEDFKEEKKNFEQINLFENVKQKEQEEKEEADERKIQNVILDIKKKYGKNAVIKGMNLQKEGTMMQRNGEIGGHKA